MISYLRNVLIGLLVLLLTACGGGGSGDNGDPAVATKPFQMNRLFPMETNLHWYYNNSTTAVFFQGTRVIAGYETHALNHPTGAREYYSTDSDNIYYLGVFVPTISVSGAGTFQADITLNEAIRFHSSAWSPGLLTNFNGQGTANITPTYGPRPVSYSGYVRYIGTEDITVPAGSFTTEHIRVNFSISAEVDGLSITIPFRTELWLANGAGIVKRIEQTTTFDLTDGENLANIGIFPEYASFQSVSGESQLPAELPVTFAGVPINAADYSVNVEYVQDGDNWLNISTDGSNNYLFSPSTTDLVSGARVARLTLTATDGATSLIIVNYTLDTPDIVVPENVPMSIGFSSMNTDATRLINVQHTGEILQLSVSASDTWFNASLAGSAADSTSQIEVSVDYASLDFATSYNGTISVTYSGNFVSETTVTIPVSVNFVIPSLGTVAPYLLHESVPGITKIRGENLSEAQGHTLQIGGMDVSGFTVVNDREIRVDYPGLPSGDHAISLSNDVGVVINGPAARVVTAPTFIDADIVINGRPESMDYDPERQAFYLVSWNLDYSAAFILQRIQQRDGSWQVDDIPITDPQAVTLTHDGSEVLVTDGACQIHHVDPDTLAITTPNQPLANCFNDVLGSIHSFNDGQVLVADTNQWPTVWEYPGFNYTTAPSIHNPNSIISGDRSRMIWAEASTTSGPLDIYYYDSNTDNYTLASLQSGDYFQYYNIALSGDGSRFMHYKHVYDENMSFAGTLDEADSTIDPGLNWDGSRAIALSSSGLKFFDLTSAVTPFPQIGSTIIIDPTVMTNTFKVYSNRPGDVAFLFGYDRTVFRMVVRSLTAAGP